MLIQTIANNLINGNLKEAKRGARSVKVKGDKLYKYFRSIGWNGPKSIAAALYLKNPNQGTWDTYCRLDK